MRVEIDKSPSYLADLGLRHFSVPCLGFNYIEIFNIMYKSDFCSSRNKIFSPVVDFQWVTTIRSKIRG